MYCKLSCLLISQTVFIIAENPLRLHLQINLTFNRKAKIFPGPTTDYLGHAYTFFLSTFKSVAVTVDLKITTNCQHPDPDSCRCLNSE